VCPGLYSERALRARTLDPFGQAIAFGILATLLAYVSADSPGLGEAALVAFAIAGVTLAMTVHRVRAYLLVKRFGCGEPGSDRARDKTRRPQMPPDGGANS
jgi:hypothetical protein